MKIWEVSVNTNLMRFYFFATKREATAFARNQRIELSDDGYELSEDTIFVDQWNIAPGRKGMAQALNDLISMTCLNEG